MLWIKEQKSLGIHKNNKFSPNCIQFSYCKHVFYRHPCTQLSSKYHKHKKNRGIFLNSLAIFWFARHLRATIWIDAIAMPAIHCTGLGELRRTASVIGIAISSSGLLLAGLAGNTWKWGSFSLNRKNLLGSLSHYAILTAVIFRRYFLHRRSEKEQLFVVISKRGLSRTQNVSQIIKFSRNRCIVTTLTIHYDVP